MSILANIILATTFVSLLGFAGALTLALNKKSLSKIIIFLVSLAAGTLLGGAFFHLLPESFELIGAQTTLLITLFSFCLFFLLEKVLHWRHCHKQDCHVHSFGYMNLIGDSIHNFLDGLIIAGSFLINPGLGLTTTLAVILHEIPQEIGDFGILVHAGFSRKKALFLNVLVAFAALLGGLIGYLFASNLPNLIPYLLPLAAGGFIYIPTSDLIPEVRKETDLTKSLTSFLIFILGILLMYSLTLLK